MFIVYEQQHYNERFIPAALVTCMNIAISIMIVLSMSYDSFGLNPIPGMIRSYQLPFLSFSHTLSIPLTVHVHTIFIGEDVRRKD